MYILLDMSLRTECVMHCVGLLERLCCYMSYFVFTTQLGISIAFESILRWTRPGHPQGVQRVELIAGSIVGVVLVCFGLGTLLSQPSASAIVGGMWPKVRGDSLYTAVGLLGANVVPHTFYLHSALFQVKFIILQPFCLTLP